ncbi:MAG: hypothetical protein ACE5H0_13755, partial [Bacteroidota bacterium]
ITMFQDSAVSANRDAVTNDLVNLGARSQQYFRRPTSLGGGSNSFVGLTADAAGLHKLPSQPSNANGSYTISSAGTASQVVITGYGVETGNDGTNPVQVVALITSDSIGISVSN